jgi:hypothetical protein
VRTSPGIWSIKLKKALVLLNWTVGTFSPGDTDVHFTDSRLDILDAGVEVQQKQKREETLSGEKVANEREGGPRGRWGEGGEIERNRAGIGEGRTKQGRIINAMHCTATLWPDNVLQSTDLIGHVPGECCAAWVVRNHLSINNTKPKGGIDRL